VQRNLSTGFEDSYRRHLVVEQRKAVLETIARELSPTTTLGDIVDAAQELGWGDAMGELSLGDFAEALLGGEVAAPAVPPAVADSAEEEDGAEEARADEEEEDELLAEEEEPEDDDDLSETEEDVAPPPPVAKASKKAKAKASAKKAAKGGKSAKGGRVPTQTALPNIPAAPAKKGAGGKKLSKKAAKKAAMYVPAMQDDSDAMNLDQAAKLLIPIVRRLKEATMQDLEEQTGMGRRKLRFHIGQLVKHGRLKRHGMGRGTCYTVK
jgi:hypothetical protein